MKKMLSLILCLAMVMAVAVSAFALGDLTRPSIDTEIEIDIDKLPPVVKDFHYMVEAIGEVTLEDKEAIEAAEDAYDAMSAKFKVMYSSVVQNDRNLLQGARDEYDRLVAAQATTQPADPKPVDPNGDGTFMVIALAALSMTALVVLVSKKRAF